MIRERVTAEAMPSSASDSAIAALSAYLAIGLFVWPFGSYIAIFVWDAPIRDWLDHLVRIYLSWSVWGYPLFFACGLAGRKLTARKLGARRHLWLLVPLASVLPWWPVVLALSALKRGCS